jgi:hypothetical protein
MDKKFQNMFRCEGVCPDEISLGSITRYNCRHCGERISYIESNND